MVVYLSITRQLVAVGLGDTFDDSVQAQAAELVGQLATGQLVGRCLRVLVVHRQRGG